MEQAFSPFSLCNYRVITLGTQTRLVGARDIILISLAPTYAPPLSNISLAEQSMVGVHTSTEGGGSHDGL